MKMGKTSWIMMAGCGVMLLAVFLLPALGVRLGGVLPLLMVLLCPLSHLLMMGVMGKGHDYGEHRRADARGRAAHLASPHSPIALPAPTDRA